MDRTLPELLYRTSDGMVELAIPTLIIVTSYHFIVFKSLLMFKIFIILRKQARKPTFYCFLAKVKLIVTQWKKQQRGRNWLYSWVYCFAFEGSNFISVHPRSISVGSSVLNLSTFRTNYFKRDGERPELRTAIHHLYTKRSDRSLTTALIILFDLHLETTDTAV